MGLVYIDSILRQAFDQRAAYRHRVDAVLNGSDHDPHPAAEPLPMYRVSIVSKFGK